jgi:hypothetical protein
MHYTITKLWPLKISSLFRLLIISFFIGAWVSAPLPQQVTIDDLLDVTSCASSPMVMTETSVVTAVISGFLLILLIYAFFSSIFQFIFVDYLSSHTDHILPSFRARAGMGIRLLCFYLVTIGLIAIGAIIVLITIAIPILSSDPSNPLKLGIALLYTLAGLFILIIPIWILTIITTDFIVPIMIVHASGIIQGWRIFLQESTGKWDEIGIYLLVKIGINILTGIVLGIVMVGLMEWLGWSSSMLIPGLSSTEDLFNSDFILPCLLIAFITLVVMTPVITFLRYYALVFLQLLSERCSLLAHKSDTKQAQWLVPAEKGNENNDNEA